MALANIKISIAVNNLYEKNLGDNNYDPYQDYGYAICSYGFEAKGTGLDRDSFTIDFSQLVAILGAVSKMPLGNVSLVAEVGSSLLEAIDLISNYYLDTHRTK